MYTIKPIIDQKKMVLELPATMYKMKSIATHASVDDQLSCSNANADKSSLNHLQQRQNIIIKQLNELREKLAAMHLQLDAAVTSNESSAAGKEQSTSTKNGFKSINPKYLHEIVIYANPRNMPYSLLAFQNLWKERLNLIISCHTHSSVINLPEINVYFAKQLQKNKMNLLLPSLRVTLIWKDTNETQLSCAPKTFTPILGEVNVVRYLTRVGPEEFNYADSNIMESLFIDEVLDLCHHLLIIRNVKGRLTLLRQLSTQLGSRKFFGGSEIAASDIAVSSAFKELPVSNKDIAPNLNEWMKRVTVGLGY